MLAKLCAVLLLALAISPLPAPFQTYNEAKAAMVAPFSGEEEPGSLLGPAATKAGRSTVSVATVAMVTRPFNDSLHVLWHSPQAPSHATTDLLRVFVLRI